jgi:hypothetical protein
LPNQRVEGSRPPPAAPSIGVVVDAQREPRTVPVAPLAHADKLLDFIEARQAARDFIMSGGCSAAQL